MRSGLYAKILVAFLLLSMIPLCISAAYIFFNSKRMEREIVAHIAESLNTELQRRLERRAVETAGSITMFLRSCESDLHALELIPRNPRAYIKFASAHQSEIWDRVGTPEDQRDTIFNLPLYREIGFIDTSGQEIIRIIGIQQSAILRNVKDPRKTTYRSEVYFRATNALPPGGLYVSHVTGWHVSKRDQLLSARRPEDAPGGQRYEGVIRFAKPAYDDAGHRIGVVVLSLDHRHLMEFTQHINPLGNQRIVFPSYDSGNYAFLFDDDGWIITHPKYWDMRGLDSLGRLVAPYSEQSTEAQIEEGRIPFNLFSAGFIHENYPRVASEVQKKRSGSVTAMNVGRTTKLMAYAPIPFDKGEYRKTGVFGGITIGAQVEAFHRPVDETIQAIDRIISFSLQSLYGLIGIVVVTALVLSFSFSRRLTKPLNEVVMSVHRLAEGEKYQRVAYRGDDEIGDLAISVNQLAFELEFKQEKLEESIDQLEQSKRQLEVHTHELEHRLHLLEQIQRVSDLLGTTFNLETILQFILRTSVEGLGFDRAILYLLNREDQTLEYSDSYGFTPAQEAAARAFAFQLGVSDCVETKVVQERKLVYVENIDRYAGATPLDFSIRRQVQSRAFAFAPLMVQEKVMGILGVGRHKSAMGISDTELHSLQILANHAARVIEMSRLYVEIFEERSFLDGILQSMLAGIIAVDTEGNITSLNAAAERMLTITAEEAIGKPLRGAFIGDSDAAALVQESLDWSDRYGKFELKFRKGNDERIFYLTSARIQSAEHQNLGIILVLQDITDRRQFDEHVSRMERLASLGRLAAGVAHEIRNPLTGLSLLLDDLHDRLRNDSVTQSQIQATLDVVERIEELVTQLLAHASPRRDVVQECNINRLIEDTLALVKNQIKKSNVNAEVELDRSLKPLAADSHRLAQALLNIILNAIQSMPDGGTLRIATSEVHADLLGDESLHRPGLPGECSSVIIRIADTGAGIPREIQQRIFEPFFTTKPEGTGLGLYISHQIIADHGGSIFVVQNEGRGSTFSIFLPRSGVTRKQA